MSERFMKLIKLVMHHIQVFCQLRIRNQYLLLLFILDREFKIKNMLLGGEKMSNDEMISSLNGKYHFSIQPDGNLELHKKKNRKKDSKWKVIWGSRTTGAGDPPYTLLLVKFSNELVVKDSGSNIIWSSGTKVSSNNNWIAGGHATMEENGNFVLYDGNGRTMWSSDTVDGEKSSAFGSGKMHLGIHYLHYYCIFYIITTFIVPCKMCKYYLPS